MLETHIARIRNLHPGTFPSHALPGWNAKVREIVADPFTPADPVRMRHDARLDWETLVAPDSSYNDISIRNPLNSLRVDCVFEAYAQIVRQAEGFTEETKWTTYTVPRLLTPDPNHPYGFGFNPSPVQSLDDLRARFQRALLLKGHDLMVRWRAAKGISLQSDIALENRVPQTIDPITAALNDMFGSAGMETAYSLNSYHAGARRVRQVVVTLTQEGFSFLLYYGYDGSSWAHELASTRMGEPFHPTCQRAYASFKTIIPDAKAQRSAIMHDLRRAELQS